MSLVVKENVAKNATIFGKLPVNSLEIKSDRENRALRNKTGFFLFLDALLLGALITVIVLASKSDCETSNVNVNCMKVTLPPLIYMLILVALSFILDWRTFH